MDDNNTHIAYFSTLKIVYYIYVLRTVNINLEPNDRKLSVCMYVQNQISTAPLSADESVKSFIYSLPDASLGLLFGREKFVVVSADSFSECVDEVCELYAYDARHGADEDARLCEREVAEVHDVLRVYVRLGDIPVRIDFSNEIEDRSQIVQRCQPVRNQKN